MLNRQTRTVPNALAEKVEVTVTFSALELEELENVASKLDLYVPEFVHQLVIEALNQKRVAQKRK